MFTFPLFSHLLAVSIWRCCLRDFGGPSSTMAYLLSSTTAIFVLHLGLKLKETTLSAVFLGEIQIKCIALSSTQRNGGADLEHSHFDCKVRA
jgi:hypothetical protein